jgi:hypothetical protein
MIGNLVGMIAVAIFCAVAGFIPAFILQVRAPTDMKAFLRWWGLFFAVGFVPISFLLLLIRGYWFYVDNIAPLLAG